MSTIESGSGKEALILFPVGDNIELPPRSKLYGLVPCEMGTMFQESLTSYLNRLGWRHHVSPRDLVAQEIVPSLSHEYPKLQLAAFSRGPSMQINGAGSVAYEWATDRKSVV